MLGALLPNQIDELLKSEVIGRIGCHANGKTYVVPITYMFEGDCIYGQSGLGQKIYMMRANPEVCFEVDRLQDLSNWKSVIAWGTYEELTGEEAKAGLAKLEHRFMPLMTSKTGTSMEPEAWRENAVVFRVRIHEKSGRFESNG